MWPSLVGRLDGVQEVAGSNPVIPTMRAVSSVGRASRLHREGQRFESFTAHHTLGSRLMVGLQTLNLTMVVRSHPPQPRAPVDQRIDRRFAEPEAVGSIPARCTTSTHSETDITEVFETSSPGSTPGECSNYFFLRDLRRRRGAGTNFLGFWRMRK